MECIRTFLALATFVGSLEFVMAAIGHQGNYGTPWGSASPYSTPLYNPAGSRVQPSQAPQELPILLGQIRTQQQQPVPVVQYHTPLQHYTTEGDDAVNMQVGKELAPIAGAAAKSAVLKASGALKKMGEKPPTLWKVLITIAVFGLTFYVAGVVAGLLRIALAAYVAFKAFDVVETGDGSKNPTKN